MKKLTLGLAILLLSGCNSATTPEQSQNQAVSEYEQVAKSIAAGKAVRCKMTSTADGSVMNYAMKGEKVRITNLTSAEAGSPGEMILDGEYVYTWSNDKKEGTKYQVPEVTEQTTPDGTTSESTTEFKPEDIQDYEDMGYTVDCNDENVPDVEFVPPSDVTFTDLSAMMNDLNNSRTNPEMSEEQKAEFNKLMEQYQQ